MISTKDNIVEQFGINQFCIYNDMGRILQEKYRLYITRRINVGNFKTNDTLSPSDWLEEYNKKKDFEYIGEKLGITTKEVIEIYDTAISKMKSYCDKKNTRSSRKRLHYYYTEYVYANILYFAERK